MQSASTPVEIRPTLSIVTICKDHPAGFQDTMNSVRQQMDYTPANTIEWIVVNGSTDSDAVAQMIDANRDIVTFEQSKPDKGIFYAMNTGLEQANGQFVQFMNAGDTFVDPWTVLQMNDTIQANPQCDFLYGDFQYGDHLRRAQDLSFIRCGVPTSHQSMAYKTDLIGDLRYDTQYSLAADYKFTMEYLKKVQNPIHEPYAISIFEGGGSTENKYRKSAMEVFDIRRKAGEISTFKNMLLASVSLTGGALRKHIPRPMFVAVYNAYLAMGLVHKPPGA